MGLMVSEKTYWRCLQISDPGPPTVTWLITEGAYWHIKEAANRVWGIQSPYYDNTDAAVFVRADFSESGVCVGISDRTLLIRYEDLDKIDRIANKCWGMWRD